MSNSSSDDSTAGSQKGRHVTTRSVKKTRPSPAKIHDMAPTDTRRIRVKVPPFSPEEPEIWFALLEGQFLNYGIQDDVEKYTHVITNLDLVHAKAVKDLIVNPPDRHRYVKIKTELIRRLSASHELKIKQLLTHEELGDRKPSQFLRHLQDLAGPAVPADFIKTIWTQRLPSNIQTLVASQPTLSLEQLADLTDKVHEIVSPCNVAMASTSYNNATSVASEIADLKKMVERLSLKVENQARSANHVCPSDRSRRQRPTARHHSRDRPRSRSTSDHKKYPLCWYHHTFGSRAGKCIKPCDFSLNATGSR